MAFAAAILVGISLDSSTVLAATTRSGVIHVYEVGTAASPNNTDVITGAFTDYGMDEPAKPHSLNTLELSKGSFQVDIAKLEARAKTSYNPKSCSVVITGTGPTSLSNGTGAYASIRGTVTIHLSEAGIYTRSANGSCNQNSAAPIVAVSSLIEGSGRITF